jgi:hypothetical protein
VPKVPARFSSFSTPNRVKPGAIHMNVACGILCPEG